MITKEDIQKLAHLARIEIEVGEAESLAKEADSILAYVSQVENMDLAEESEPPLLRNVMREDVVTHEASQFSEDLLSNAPYHKDDYLQVKKILE